MYSSEEFEQMLDYVEENLGCTLKDIEDGKMVKEANKKVRSCDSKAQAKAQYGRLMPAACDKMLREILKLKTNEVFVDIGHGIGTIVLQAAFTIGCESRGIEVVGERNNIAISLLHELEKQIMYANMERVNHETKVGKVSFERGELHAPAFRDFLTMSVTGACVKAFCNNFNDVFGTRSANPKQLLYLDHYVAGLFAVMKPGSVLVTLQELPFAVPCLDRANEIRMNQSLPTKNNSSFYSKEEMPIGEANEAVSWSVGGGNSDNIIVYKYTRIDQGASNDEAVFLCCNPVCSNAKQLIYLPATKTAVRDDNGVEVAIGGVERTTVNDECTCGQAFPRNRNKRKC